MVATSVGSLDASGNLSTNVYNRAGDVPAVEPGTVFVGTDTGALFRCLVEQARFFAL